MIPLLAAATFLHLTGLLWLFGRRPARGCQPPSHAHPLLLMVGIVALHLAQAGLFAGAYLALGASNAPGDAMVLAIGTGATSIQHGDLDPPWDLALPLQSLHGLLMLGWSIAFLVGRGRSSA